DFLTDENFIKYCLREEAEVIMYWEKVITDQPELAEIIHQAESLFIVLALKIDPLEKQRELDKLKFAIESESLSEPIVTENPQRIIRFKPKYAWLSAVAAILICIGVYSLFNS